MNKPEFVVPYNFIPLLNGKAKADKEEGNLTGVIEYTLETKTPLFIPNSSNDHAFPRHNNGIADHKSYDFFSYDDLSEEKDCENKFHTPVIPGSEMRGVLRSAYETLTNSCMSSINDQTQMSKRTMESFKPGLICRNSNGTFDLVEAETCIARFAGDDSFDDDTRTYRRGELVRTKSYNQKSLTEGQMVNFDYIDRGKHVLALARNVRPYKDNNRDYGYVIKGTDFNTKHCLHILYDLRNDPILTDIDLTPLKKTLKTYRDNRNLQAKNNTSSYDEYEKRFKEFEAGKGNGLFPVYYSIPGESSNGAYTKEDKKLLMLSPAQKTREIYNLKLGDLIGSYVPCDDKDNLCPACSLFGTVSTRGNSFARASRIRVSDLHIAGNDVHVCYDKVRNLAILGSPKRNNMEFYLKRPDNAYFWTYEYYIDVNGRLHRQKAKINGRKFYWNFKPNEAAAYLSDANNSNQNVTVRPVKKGVQFKGKLYFEHITEKQLKQLIWLLNCGDEGDIKSHKHWLKIGMAKPLGFGSAAVSVDNVRLRQIHIDNEKHEIMHEDAQYSWTVDDSVFEGSGDLTKNLNNFKNAVDSRTVENKQVSYPIEHDHEKDEDKGFHWYSLNHGKRNLKSDNRIRITESSMPNDRNSMAFVYYMQAGNPSLQETTSDHVPSPRGNNGSSGHNRGSFKDNHGHDQKKPFSYNKQNSHNNGSDHGKNQFHKANGNHSSDFYYKKKKQSDKKH